MKCLLDLPRRGSILLMLAGGIACLEMPTLSAGVSFNRDILPILSDHCFHCHGPDDQTRKAGLRLDTEKGIRAAKGEDEVIAPGHPEQSELVRRILSEDADERMPPPELKKPLTAGQVEMLRRWIEEGAPWEGHWAFVPPRQPSPPEVEQEQWPRNPIDRFILARLEEAGLRPNPEADRRTLLRRVTFDLTGLPPTPAEVEAFVGDRRPDAYERVVDRLLASERYGERMALAWLDAARYGDSSVYHADGVRHMWPWRDWVIRAYNGNMPFDQFTIEQLAGDLLPDATLQQKVASGFNRNHGTTDEGGAIDEEYRVEYVVDRVKTTSTIWLGLTMECGQCHDHKYDPISQRDYYAFYAYFNRTKDRGMQTRGGNAPPLVHLFTPEQRAQADALLQEIADTEKRHRERRPEKALVSAWAQDLRDHPEPDPPEMSAWKQLGPFPADNAKQAFDKDFGPEKQVDLEKEYGGKRWEETTDYADGKPVTLPTPANAALYLHRTLTVPAKESYELSFGSDDSIKVWLNGKSILASNASRAVAADQEKVRIDLEGGSSTLLVKIGNGGGPSGFYFKVLGSGIPEEMQELIAIADADLSDEQRAKLAEYYQKNWWPEGLARAETIAALKAEEKRLRDSVPTCMVMEDMENPRPTHVLHRGHYASPIKEEVIEPGVPSFLGPLPEEAPPNRLGLARWLTRPDHPLTARVTVNRYWQMLFGTGLVATDTDFGTRGEWPSHPDLLDWLARDFAGQGWDVKHALKQMVMSATYRQSSRVTRKALEKDPDNRLHSRGPRFRLQGEFVRDNALVLADLLQPTVGGPSVKPYQPPGIWNEVSLDGNLKYEQDKGRKLYRRSMYIYWKRSAPSPSMMAFDAPTREKCVIRRQRTNTPLQALVTLNDVQFVEAARLFAERILREAGPSLSDRIDHAFLLATGRPADGVRQETLQSLYHRQHAVFEEHPDRAKDLVTYGEYPSGEDLDPAELAAWTTVTSVILNLDEVLTKE